MIQDTPDFTRESMERRHARQHRRRQEQRSLEFYSCLVVVLLAFAAILLFIALSMLSNRELTLITANSAGPVSASIALSTQVAPTPPSIPSPTVKPTLLVTPTTIAPDALRLTLADIFPPRNISNLDASRLRIIIATGDVVPARNTDATIRKQNDDFGWVLSATKDILSSGDLTVANLEAPLIKTCPLHLSGFTMCGRPGFALALKNAGVDWVTLENNHIGNYGYAGIVETTGYLKNAGLAFADRYTPITTTIRGLKFGIVAVNGVGESIDKKAFVAQIRGVRPQVDVLIAAIHWGEEYVAVPRSAPGIAPDDPITIAHLAIDAGVDLVIGNHPHWVQGVEIYKNKFITYAHGNFVFDQNWSEETLIGVIGKYTFYDRTLVRVEFIPTKIENSARPVPLSGQDTQNVLNNMKTASEEIARLVKTR